MRSQPNFKKIEDYLVNLDQGELRALKNSLSAFLDEYAGSIEQAFMLIAVHFELMGKE